jgi:cobalt-zinc-cadmium efflux system membrane fusion protein
MSPVINHICLGLGLMLFVSGCQKAAAVTTKPAAPSKVTNAVKEDKLSMVELTEAAETRLGIETASIEMKTLPRHRAFGGEVTLPTGATIIVSTPMTGRLQSPAGGKVPRAGTAVVEKQPVMVLLPLLSPAEKIALATQATDAEGQIQQAQAVVEQRRIDLERAELQNQKGVGLKATLDTAKAQLIQSEKALEAATVRKNVLDTSMNGEGSAEQKPFLIESPQAGILRAMHVMPGEFVMAGSPLFEVLNVDTLWIRVPVYVGEVAEIATDQSAEVGELAARPGQTRAKAEPISAPPTATALSSTIDLYYQLPNPKGTLRPSQRVSVELPLVGDAEQRCVPWSAVVQDIHGGAWIYEKIADHKFVRRRVQVKQIVDQWAVLEQGPPVGTEIVKTGVAEVFGTEFWVQK